MRLLPVVHEDLVRWGREDVPPHWLEEVRMRPRLVDRVLGELLIRRRRRDECEGVRQRVLSYPLSRR
jgi:hypothetical protein